MPSPDADAEHAEAIDLLAAWVVMAGLEDPGALHALLTPGFVYRDGAAEEEPVPRPTRALRVCGDPEMYVVDGGYDVTLRVQVIQGEGLLRSGERRLTFRGPARRLQITSDTFVVGEETSIIDRSPTGDPFLGVSCGGQGALERDCVIVFEADEPPRRIPYPESSVREASR